MSLSSGLNCLSRYDLSYPGANPNEQFYIFVLLFSWLLSKSDVPFETPGQFDDPNATYANIGL